MIVMESGGVHFSVRSAGVAIDRGRVLLQTARPEGFYTLPGGRVEIDESASEALEREIIEELGIKAVVGRLLWIVENFFTFNDRRYHEHLFLFDMQIPEDSELMKSSGPFVGCEEALKMAFEWKRIDSLKGIEVYPEFLRYTLARIPESMQHVVIHDVGAMGKQ